MLDQLASIDLLNLFATSLTIVLPTTAHIKRNPSASQPISFHFGTSITLQGDMPGVFLITASKEMFQKMAKGMYDMVIHKDMVPSFACELGNMMAGTLSTILGHEGIRTVNAAPILIDGPTTVTGYNQVTSVSAAADGEVLYAYLLQ